MKYGLWDKAFLINLDKREDRLRRVTANLSSIGIDFQRVSAVSPETLPSQPPEGLRDFIINADGVNPEIEHKVQGTWACMHSHLKIIKMAKDAGLNKILILEDDCEFESFSKKILSLVENQITNNDIDFDFLYLGGRFVDGCSKDYVSENLIKVNRIRCTYGYIIDKSMFDLILDEAPKQFLPIDWYYSEVLLKKIQALMIYPEIVNHDCEGLSDIENTVQHKKKLSLSKKLKLIINKIKYR